MPGLHARLAPSSAERWISCPASIRLTEKLKAQGLREEESSYAREGTLAHALGELLLSHALGHITAEEYAVRYREWREDPALDSGTVTEMLGHITAYVDFVLARAAQVPDSVVLVEQKMETGIPHSSGTSDAVIFSPVHVESIDLKYGAGIPVHAAGNPQLRLYACGALDTFGDLLGTTETVRTTVYQPRLDSITSEEITAEELREWRESIRPVAEEALTEDARFGPSEKACRFCPAAGECRARVELMTRQDFGKDPDLVDAEELAELLAQVPQWRSFANAVEEAALRKAYGQGETLPGWKVVLSGGRRSVPAGAQGKAIDVLVAAGYDREKVAKLSLRTLGELEKLVGKKALPEVLGDLLVKGEGKPSMVPEDDPRESVDPNSDAARVFTEAKE